MSEDLILTIYVVVVGLCAFIGLVVVPWYSERAHRKFADGIAQWYRDGGRL